ncbi:MAG TPA: serine/threonine protein kinase [Thermoanaerobaculia bacterium]|jgi:Ser/Thr protein kinase RdoA (MazF antagonist)|nr:serine/threonine protein kinase [Thermoanaerobaculia bacterium]
MTDLVAAPETDLFLSLTPEKVLAAVEAGGLRCNPVCYPLNSFENRVYEVELADRTRVVAKFYRPGRWSEEQILEEHQFLADLAAEEIPVCTVRPFPGGGSLRRVEGIFYSLSDRRGGRAPDELSDETVRRLGMLVGRMHNVAVRRPAPHRLRLDAATYVREPVAWLDAHDTLPRHLRSRYFDAALAIAEIADRRLAGVAVHRLHGDLHLGNLLFRDGLLHVLDFDDMVVGPAVQDLWLALPGRDASALAQREVFVEGYESFREFDRSTLVLIEPLRALRIVHYTAWLARRWHDPAFPAAWPHFGTPDYWQRETEDLEEQLAVLRGEASPEEVEARTTEEAAREEETTLTNKDFFWDWEG